MNETDPRGRGPRAEREGPWGSETPVRAVNSRFLYHAAMLFLLSLMIRVLARVLAGHRTDVGAKDLEILVLRHQVRVLKRKTGRPRLRAMDRVLLAAASRILPRDRWASFMLSPQTLLRWHRELVRSKWTYRSRTNRDGRRSTPRSAT